MAFKDRLKRGLCLGWSLAIISMENGEIDEFYGALKLLSVWGGSAKELKENHSLEDLFENILRKLIKLQSLKHAEATVTIPLFKKNNDAIFNLGFLLRQDEIAAILMDVFQNTEKIIIGSLGDLLHSIVIRKTATEEFVIYDNSSSIGPVQAVSIKSAL